MLKLFLLSLLGCSEPIPKWTDEDKANIEHFYVSQRADKSAVAISNRGTAFTIVSEGERKEFLRLKAIALLEAKTIKDEVLAKAHPELPYKFRSLYQKSLELTIKAMEERDNVASFRAGQLHDEWVNWFNKNKKAIKNAARK